MNRTIESTKDTGLIHRDDFYHKIRPLRSWLVKELGMRDIIEEMTLPHRTPPSERQVKKFEKGINILRKTTMPVDFIEKNIKRAKDMTMVFNEKGKWDPVNKLNTNHSDIALLLTELVVRSYEDNPSKTLEFYTSIMTNTKEGFMKMKPHLNYLVQKYFTFEDLRENVTEIKRYTKKGDEAEDTVIEWLEYIGYTVVYHGGDGDMIDMLFGTDIIVSDNQDKHYTVQVKRSKQQLTNLDYLNVDWIVFVEPQISVFERTTKKELSQEDLRLDD
jgi:hypothetical protein